ncbi:phosphatidylinositol alpha-mannosyltransferase [Glycomyces sambucus]|uniref:Phosphatidylinositol alpha-mannosyltransferase n=1 Tax=Glycomyces sambucus TaxID=380244 RepID=A0A1G9D153_9ACTN|nr:glycosyltransferase family 4 protein [Glycomyces sambucus]SDK57646.1 phosphatidylinositol alpha-mannosyltransferase [Glycomyces sambucus]
MGDLRIGIVSPYSFDVPGGVQFHIRDLAETLIDAGHDVSVLAPATETEGLPDFVVSGGKAVAVPYNGSIARLAFGPLSAARVRKWCNEGGFDVIHVHEPLTPSLSCLAVLNARCPVVATFHTAMTRSRMLAAGKHMAQLVLENLSARIAVSAYARKVQVEHLGGGAVEIPNGVPVAFYRKAAPLADKPDGPTIGFMGRFTEPRKGFPILRDAFARLAADRPDLHLLVVGRGDPEAATAGLDPDTASRIRFLGAVSDEEKASMLAGVDLYVAPNTGGESFGMILTEAMAAGTCVLASDIEAFRSVLDDGRAGELFTMGDAADLAARAGRLLDEPERRTAYTERANEWVRRYDWPEVAARLLEVYRAAIEAGAERR